MSKELKLVNYKEYFISDTKVHEVQINFCSL